MAAVLLTLTQNGRNMPHIKAGGHSSSTRGHPIITGIVKSSATQRTVFKPPVFSATDLAQFRDNLLRSKSFPCHLLSPFQIGTLIASGSEKVGQVMKSVLSVGT